MTILTFEQAIKTYKGVLIHEYAAIHEGAVIHEGAEISKVAVIGAGAVIGYNRKNVNKNIVISGIGNTKNITAYTCDDGLVVNIGCVNNYSGLSIPEMRDLISKKYDLDHEYFFGYGFNREMV